jgi:hypothetical protein
MTFQFSKSVRHRVCVLKTVDYVGVMWENA